MRLPHIPSMSNRFIGRIDVPSMSSAGYIIRAATGLGTVNAIMIVRIVIMIATTAVVVTDKGIMIAEMGVTIAGATTVANNRHSTVQVGAGVPQHSEDEGGQLPALPIVWPK